MFLRIEEFTLYLSPVQDSYVLKCCLHFVYILAGHAGREILPRLGNSVFFTVDSVVIRGTLTRVV
jgi:hypothetical protein